MAITISNQIENHRSIYFEFTGDGATTNVVVTHNQYKQPLAARTCKSFLVTGETKLDRGSNRGGHIFPTDGTAVTVNSTTEAASGTVTIVCNAAVGNGTKCKGVIIFDQFQG